MSGPRRADRQAEPLFRAIATLARAGMRLMAWDVDLRGEEHLPRHGPAVIACNHVGYLDPVQIGWVVDRHDRVPRFLAKRELFDHRLLGPVMRKLAQVPVDREHHASAALPAAVKRLRAGDWVVVFPEGTITTSFVPATPRLGAARLALVTGAPLVPAALWGSHRILTKGRPRNLERGVRWSVRIGAPVPVRATDDPAALTARLWDVLAGLVDEVQRGYPQRPAGDDDRWWLPAHLGGTAPTVGESARGRDGEGRAPGKEARP